MEEKNIEQDEITIDLWILLRDFIRGCIKFWWLILALMVACGAIMFVTNIQTYTPMYQASATFTVTTNTTTDQNNQSDYNYYYDSSTAEQLSLTFPYILSSQILNDAIEADLGVEAINGSISASIIPNSNMITMTVISSDPDDAKEILESTIRVYPSVARFVIGMTKFNMIENPSVSNVPYNQPNYFNTVAKGALIGLAVGLVIIAIYAFFRKTVHKTQELEEVTNIKCLATVPYLKQKKRSRGKTIMPSILNLQTNPLFLENIESLHIRLAKELADINGKTLIFTSTVAKEGKSTIATNVAYALAKNNKKVLLIDADLRKQDLSKQMNLTTNGVGLSSIKYGSDVVEDAIVYLEKQNLYFLGGNSTIDDLTTVLTNPNMEQFMKDMKQKMDYIIFDAPPCEAFEDVFLLEKYGDAFVYVIKQDFVQRHRIVDCIATLADSELPLLGYVFNGDSFTFNDYGRYRYRYYNKYGYRHYSYYNNEKKAIK